MSDIRTVLCPVDFSAVCQPEIDLAVEICRRLGARLVIEHNFDPSPPSYMAVAWMWSEEQLAKVTAREQEAHARMHQVLGALPADLEYEGKLTRGPIDLALLYVAQEVGADLIVMASHGPSNPEHRSVTEKVIVEAPCPVLTLPASCASLGPLGRLSHGAEELLGLVPVEFEPHSLAAMRYAFALARLLPLRLHLLHVEGGQHGEVPAAAEKDRTRLAAMIPEDLTQRVEVHVESGSTVEEILQQAAATHAAVILMGTHPKGAIARFLSGTTSLEILHHSPCPVWFAPARSVAENGARVNAGGS